MPDPDTYRWIAARGAGRAGRARLPGHHALARPTIDRLAIRGRDLRDPAVVDLHPRVDRAAHQRGASACALFARLRRPVAAAGRRAPSRLRARLPALADLPRPQPVRAPRHARVAGRLSRPPAPPRTPRWATRSGARGILIGALPMVELTDLPETSEKVIRQNARWYLGVLDDMRVPGAARGAPRRPRSTSPSSPATSATRWSSGPSPRSCTRWWAISAGISPIGSRDHPVMFYARHRAPVDLARAHDLGRRHRHPGPDREPRALPAAAGRASARTRCKEKFWGTFRCQTYWLLATRGAWRVLLALGRSGRFEPAKTDRVIR